jgi:16S rRNA (adenine1518-N6/adenine1519-N6)-dimethyltransferase
MREEERYPKEVRSLLSQYGLRAKKSLGQHFLIDKQALHRIVSAACLTSEDTVIEVGPGLGVLTQEMARLVKRVIAVEADSKLAAALGGILDAFPNVHVICSDILQTDTAFLSASTGFDLGASPYKVVANIPYYITSPILRHFLEASHKPCLMVIMVQKEVGEAIVAEPGEMSLLAVSVQFYGKPQIVDYVPALSFYPSPKVDSAILQIEPYEQPPVQVLENSRFFDVVRAGFSAPRKQLRNALAQGLSISPQAAAGLIEEARINPQRRAETLNLQEWAKIYEVANEYRTRVQI